MHTIKNKAQAYKIIAHLKTEIKKLIENAVDHNAITGDLGDKIMASNNLFLEKACEQVRKNEEIPY